MAKNISLDEIDKIVQILLINQNKINLLRKDLSNNLKEKNNSKIKTNQFLNGLEIDIKNILSLLDRIKANLNRNNQSENPKTYYLNSDKNTLQDILICGCCQCCGCRCCECSTNNCTEIRQLNDSRNNNEYIKENINSENDKDTNNLNMKTFNQNYPNFNGQQPASNFDNNYTYPNLNSDNNFNNNRYNDNNNALDPNESNNDRKIIYSKIPSFPQQNNNINYNKEYPDLNRFGYIKKQPFNNNMIFDENNLQIEEKMKNSAIIKSKRFHGSKSFDNIDVPYSPKTKKGKIIKNNNILSESYDRNNNKYNDNFNNNNLNYKKHFENNNIQYNNKGNIINNNNLLQKKIKMEKLNEIQKFLDKLYKQPKEIVERFKKVYGEDIEEKLLNGEIDNNGLNEMENILNKIIKMSIWGQENKSKKKGRSGSNNSYDRKNKRIKHNFIYNPVQEKIKLMKSMKNNQAYYREFPRGWYSTKEYFINNGTEINNENPCINKYI